MRTRFFILLISLTSLISCTQTPDLNQWASNSAMLQSTVVQTNTSILDKTDNALASIKTGMEKESWDVISKQRFDDWSDKRDSLAIAVAQIDVGMSAMTVYAQGLSNLAAQGESGQAATQSISTSLKTLRDTFELAYPSSSSLGAGLSAVVSEVADIATRIQAQNDLAAGMSAAQKSVDSLAQSLQMSTQAMQGLIGPITSLQESYILGKYGKERIRYYQSQNAYQQTEALFASADPDEISNTLSSLEKIADDYRAYQQEIQAVREWRSSMRTRLNSIAEASILWAQTHEDAQKYLNQCGAWRSFNKACGDFSAAKLMAIQQRIQNLYGAFNAAPSQP